MTRSRFGYTLGDNTQRLLAVVVVSLLLGPPAGGAEPSFAQLISRYIESDNASHRRHILGEIAKDRALENVSKAEFGVFAAGLLNINRARLILRSKTVRTRLIRSL